MMYSMVAIIPANLIVFSIDTVDGIFFRIIGIYKCMLRPVTQHHYHTGKYKGNDEYPQSGLKIDKTHTNAKKIKRYFTIAQAHVKLLSFSIEQVHECITKPQEKKTGNIAHESTKTITAVS